MAPACKMSVEQVCVCVHTVEMRQGLLKVQLRTQALKINACVYMCIATHVMQADMQWVHTYVEDGGQSPCDGSLSFCLADFFFLF